MTEQWQELKETVTEMRDSGGTGTQQEVCKFLVNYMNVLEKQMQEPILNKIREEIKQASYEYYFEYGEYIGEDTQKTRIINTNKVLQIIDKYKAESDEQERSGEE